MGSLPRSTPVSTPPSLVAPPTQSYSLNAGETATVTFQVTVAGTTTSVSNTATASSRQVTTVTSNAVTHNVELATITKSANPASGSNVLQGSTITYNVDVKNTGALPLTATASHRQPAGRRHLCAGQLQDLRCAFAGAVPGPVHAQSYSNSDGVTAWAGTPWVESGDGATSPTNGRIQILADAPQGNVLQVRGNDDGRSIRRPINLAACAHRHVELRLAGGPETSPAGRCTSTCHPMAEPTGSNRRRSPARRQLDTPTYSLAIPAQFRVATAQLRFRTATNNGERFNVDNVKVEGLCGVVAPLTNAARRPLSSRQRATMASPPARPPRSRSTPR